ncbi:6-phosphogluconolactonase [Stieleria maiorica]|uniref:6-phosphogluconolactonase n=1 Tax=Stieleria maiorica TaxID=2795974 RepID=A0A5B9ML36_9BACT|nr:lactonase family protein [Stieleria maiorica]QEG01644.1 6-phosphogluconolactonase [Stieleria maiorica]
MRIAALLYLFLAGTVCSAETLVYFGTYTRGDSASEGIYVAKLDAETGALSQPRLAAEADNPSFVAIAPGGKTLYAVSETPFTDENSIGIVSYSILADGTLKKLNERSTRGGGACHVAVDPSGKCLGVANYGGGSCASFPINDDGSMGEIASFHQHVGSSINPRRQQEAHAHSINFNADGTQAFVADLGLDQIVIYDVDLETAAMTPSKQRSLKMPAGGGPRHFCFAAQGSVAFANLELTSQVALLRYDDAAKCLSVLDVASTLPGGRAVPGNSTAECLLHPNGRIGYVSNRGHNSIAVFGIDASDGNIRWIENESTRGEIPRGFGIDPGGKFVVVANQKTGNIVSLKIDPATGALSPTGSEINVGTPVNVRFLRRL